MNEPVTSDETARRWKRLLEVYDQLPSRSSTTIMKNSEQQQQLQPRPASSVVDPFDCSSLIIGSTRDLVEKTMEENLIRWNQLDDRKIKQQRVQYATTTTTTNTTSNDTANEKTGETISNDQNTEPSPQKSHATPVNKGGWFNSDGRLQLPAGFDYATTRTDPPSDDDNDDGDDGDGTGGGGDRVLCLDAPLTASGQPKTVSYHAELWKLFKSIPSCHELEDKYHRNHKLKHTAEVCRQMDDPTTTKKARLNKNLEERWAVLDQDIVLSMFRTADRHGYPPHKQQHDNQQKLDSGTVTTLWLECWKLGTMPVWSSSPDENRMVVEFWDGQTLLDVHNTIRQMLEDDQWSLLKARTQKMSKTKSMDTSVNEGNGIEATNTTTIISPKTINLDDESGCFFIENRWYKTGSADYCDGTTDWLNGGKDGKNTTRLGYFGISTTPGDDNDGTTAHQMKDVKLSQIPFQLGTRYFHCCHGDVETSIMLIDRQESQKAPRYPIIHDIWIPAQWKTIPLCDACQRHRVFYVVGGQSAATDGGPKLLCEECCLDMKLLERQEPTKDVALFSSWSGLG